MDKQSKYTDLIKAKIAKYASKTVSKEVGKVISVSDGIAIVSGLDDVMLNEVVTFDNGTQGLALNLESGVVGIILLGSYNDIQENSLVYRTKTVMSIPVGDELLGRVISPLGIVIDGKPKLTSKKTMPIEKIAPGVMTRKPVDAPIETGYLTIDAMFPIGKGQRELIVGDRQTGKTTLAIDTIINQKGKNVKCVYVCIGQKNSSLARIIRTLQSHESLKYTTVVSATASSLPAEMYLAPYAGITIAEEWMAKGEDVLIIYDDLTKHAQAYRTISLLLRRPSGREAYPGDVFYLHSRLLERACRLDDKFGGGSITALPIVETQNSDISAYIPTNIISITDGQLFLQSNLFNLGQKPAIDVGLSVSRVGSAAQYKAVKQTSSSLKIELSQYSEMQAFAQFGNDLDASTLKIINNGKKITELLKQDVASPIQWVDQAILLFAVKNEYLDFIPLEELNNFKNFLVEKFNKSEIYAEIKLYKYIDKALELKLKTEIVTLLSVFASKLVDYDKKLLDKINSQLEELLQQKVEVEVKPAVKKLEEKKAEQKKIEKPKKAKRRAK